MRRADSHPRFVEVIHKYQHQMRTPIVWGKDDPFIFVCNHLEAVTGSDVGALIRGKYNDVESAKLFFENLCGGGKEKFCEWLANGLRLTEISPHGSKASGSFMLGDLGYFADPQPDGEIGVCYYGDTFGVRRDHRVCFPTKNPGLTRAWSID